MSEDDEKSLKLQNFVGCVKMVFLSEPTHFRLHY